MTEKIDERVHMIANILFNHRASNLLNLDVRMNMSQEILLALNKTEKEYGKCKWQDESCIKSRCHYEPQQMDKMFPISACCNAGAMKPANVDYYVCTNCNEVCCLTEWSKPKPSPEERVPKKMDLGGVLNDQVARLTIGVEEKLK